MNPIQSVGGLWVLIRNRIVGLKIISEMLTSGQNEGMPCKQGYCVPKGAQSPHCRGNPRSAQSFVLKGCQGQDPPSLHFHVQCSLGP